MIVKAVYREKKTLEFKLQTSQTLEVIKPSMNTCGELIVTFIGCVILNGKLQKMDMNLPVSI